MKKLVIERVTHHRNGVSGNGFYVLLFREGKTLMMGVVFEEAGSVAVFDRSLFPAIDFTVNSWRGDYYEDDLRSAIADYKRATELLPSEKWFPGWSPITDPLP
jgi:hypothetical protein